jgi:hypothetical protein
MPTRFGRLSSPPANATPSSAPAPEWDIISSFADCGATPTPRVCVGSRTD